MYISSSSIELFWRRADVPRASLPLFCFSPQTNKSLTKEKKKREKYACAPRATKSALFISDGIRNVFIFFVVVE
jgi:hypothetical protein